MLLDQLHARRFKKVVQTISYLPHFLSVVVLVGMIKMLFASNGIVNDVIQWMGGEPIYFLIAPRWYRTLFIGSGIWQGLGWSSIIYLAALTGIDPQLYEAAEIDGANRLRQTWHITLPGIMPTIIMLLILRMGSILGVGYEKILLLYNETIYETADVISTYVYRKGLIEANFSYSTAVGLFNSIINVVFLVGTNLISKKVTDIGLF